jgi:phosphoribosylformimino-5-aminoimidazole carboxamide ribotide isomerase
MIIYPTIELLNGKCVSLHRGRMEEPQIWHVDPVAKAQSFAAAGAEWIHITDFDAIDNDYRNEELIRTIIRSSGASVQLGGGFGSMERIVEWIDHGAGRIVVASAAVRYPEMVKEAAKFYPDQIVVAIDVFQGHVMTDGWRTPSAFTPADFIRQFENDPLAAIIITDIDADIEQAEDSLALISAMASVAKAPVIARGLSRSLDNLSQLKYIPYVSGAILGRALFDHTIDLDDAMELAKPDQGVTAPFV